MNPRPVLPKGRYRRFYILGIVDAEGCFSVALKKVGTARFGWVLDPVFQVTQHKHHRAVLELVQSELQCGRIIEKRGQMDGLVYVVDNRRQLVEKVIPFFQKYRLIAKESDFLRFRRIVHALERREHSDVHRFAALVREAFSMNLGGKQRHYRLQDILEDIRRRADASETTSQTPRPREQRDGGDDIVHSRECLR